MTVLMGAAWSVHKDLKVGVRGAMNQIQAWKTKSSRVNY